MKLKKRKKINPILILILLSIIIYITINYINKKIAPQLIDYASIEIKKLSNLIITESIKIESLEKLNINELFIITKNENNEILTVDVNTVTLNKIIFSSTIDIQENLKKLEQGKINTIEENKNGVVLRIPLGQIYNNFLLNNLGPKIPVKLKILGDIETKVDTNIKNYGINNALIEITLNISIKEQVILPIKTEEVN